MSRLAHRLDLIGAGVRATGQRLRLLADAIEDGAGDPAVAAQLAEQVASSLDRWAGLIREAAVPAAMAARLELDRGVRR